MHTARNIELSAKDRRLGLPEPSN